MKAEALKFVIHFVGDMHQPLHDEDDGDKGGNERNVIYEGHPDNLHWVWDSGLLGHINRNRDALATDLESHITPQDREEWVKGSIADWVMKGHRLAQTVAYADLGNDDPAMITCAYEHQADPVVEIQLEKTGVKLAYLLNTNLVLGASTEKSEPNVRPVANSGTPDVKAWVNTKSGVYHCRDSK